MYIIIIYTSLLMLFTMSVQASDSVQVESTQSTYDEYFYGFMIGRGMSLQNASVERREIVDKFNLYVGKRFSERFAARLDFLDVGPKITTDPTFTTIVYYSLLGLLNCVYYILPHENLSVAVGLGAASTFDIEALNNPQKYDTRIKPQLKISMSYVPKELASYVRFEAGYQRNLVATNRREGGELTYQFAFFSLGLYLD